MSLFITFEGGEGCGKSTQSESLYKKILQSNIPTILTHEPGGTPFGEHARELLKWTDAYLSPDTELLMFNASRAQLIDEIILPNLQAGKVIICDRYIDSTVAYQGYGRGLDLHKVKLINDVASRGLKPNLSILMDMPPEIGMSRITGRPKDRFEKETLSFHIKVREGFLKIAEEEPERWIVIDATLSRQKIRNTIWQKVSQLLTVK